MTEKAVNRRALLVAYADGIPERTNFEVSDTPVPAPANWDSPPVGSRIEGQTLVLRARMRDMLIFDRKDRFAEAQTHLGTWPDDGRLTNCEEMLDGIEAAPGTIQRFQDGGNRCKLMIRLQPVEEGA